MAMANMMMAVLIAGAGAVAMPSPPMTLPLKPADIAVEYHGSAADLTQQVRSAADERFADYAGALKARDYQRAYAMLRLSYQAANPRIEWEMKLRARDGLWADGNIRVLRLSWHIDPADQPLGRYAVYDFRGDRPDGGMDCGYVVLHQPADNADFSVVRTDASYVPSSLMAGDFPQVEVLRQLPCFLGKDMASAL